MCAPEIVTERRSILCTKLMKSTVPYYRLEYAHLYICELHVQVLVNAVQCAYQRDVVLELHCNLLAHQRLEEGVEELHTYSDSTQGQKSKHQPSAAAALQ